ncbi:MAG: phage holin family protein [Oscillospiraceae bacterium]|nr:phage holin family protein [Oscillospiraceae bacterium]
MEDNLMTFKGTIAAFFMALGAFLGWQGIMGMVWVAAMALDYITGTMAACHAGQWSSAVAREGLWHKGGMIVVVTVAAIADGIMAVICANIPLEMIWPGLILPLVLAWYIITELGSILENAVKMGTPVPEWLIKFLRAGLKAVDDAAGIDKVM